MSTGKLYLFPSLMSAVPVGDVIPARNIELVRSVKYFVVEELRTARRFLKACDRNIDIDSLHFEVLNEHTAATDVAPLLAPVFEGHDIGIISEAGCPAIADPGADLVAVAQRKGIEVIPLVGPSSILLSLMGSGFNGQNFTFRGYLPVDATARVHAMREMEKAVRQHRQTQIFIETPYRNRRLIEELCAALPADMLLCVAVNLTAPTQSIITRRLADWKKQLPEFQKLPAIFLLYS